MGCLIAIAGLVALWFVPIGMSATYNPAGPMLKLILGPIRFVLYPRKHKKRKSGNRRKKTTTHEDKFETKNKKSNYSFKEFILIAQLVFEFLSDFRRKIRINRLEMKLILCGDDPCDLSINYGRCWAVLGNLLPQFERFFEIKKRDLEIECDYTAEQIMVDTRIDMTITIGRLLSIVCYHGFRGLRKYFKHIKQIKGGATT